MKPKASWQTLIVTVILPLFIGGCTYIFFRSNSLKMFAWFKALGLNNMIDQGRTGVQHMHGIPQWIIFSLPDALWLFSFTNGMLLLWNYRLTKQSCGWILLAPAIGILSEAGQAVHIVPGTFDFVDMALLLAAALTPFLINPLNKSIKIQTV